METIADLRDYLCVHHPKLQFKYGFWLRGAAHLSIEDGLSHACARGLYDLCEALGVDTSWYTAEDEVSYEFSAQYIVPRIMEVLDEST